MPVIKSAKKKLRQDKKRAAHNVVFEETYKNALKKARKSPTTENVRLATKAADKAVKHHLIHKNKAARVKSSLTKLLGGKLTPSAAKPTVSKSKKAVKKTSKKTSKK